MVPSPAVDIEQNDCVLSLNLPPVVSPCLLVSGRDELILEAFLPRLFGLTVFASLYFQTKRLTQVRVVP